jgi:hypothetical protein
MRYADGRSVPLGVATVAMVLGLGGCEAVLGVGDLRERGTDAGEDSSAANDGSGLDVRAETDGAARADSSPSEADAREDVDARGMDAADSTLVEAGDAGPDAAGDVAVSGGCDVAGISYSSGASNPTNGCLSCQPAVSTSAWSDVTDGTSCGDAGLCHGGACASDCEIAGAFYAANAVNPSQACQTCQPGVSTTAWSDLANGAGCGSGSVCNAFVACISGCFIDGAFVAPNAANGGSACQSCQPASSTTAWSDIPDGTGCGGTAKCSSGICVVPPSLLVTNMGSILNFDVSTGAYLGTFTSGNTLGYAYGMAMGPDGNLYVSDYAARDVVRYDGGSGAFQGVFATTTQLPYGIAFGPDGDLYVGVMGGDVLRFDGATGDPLGTFVPAPKTGIDFGGMTFHGGFLFVTYIGGLMYQFDATNGTTVAELYSVFSDNGPRVPVFGPDGSMYVPDWQTPDVEKFDGTTYGFVDDFISDAALSPVAIAFAPDGSLLAINDPVTTPGADTIRRYDATGTFLGTLVPVGSGGLARSTQLLVVGP